MHPDWNARFSQPGYLYGTAPNDFLAEVASRLPDGPILSLAEGEGRNGTFLAARGHAVHGVDGSSVALKKAALLAAERGVELTTEVVDLAGYRIEPGRWAAIVAIWAHVPPAIRRPLYAQVARGLRPGGMFVLETYAPSQIGRGTGGPSDPELLPGMEQLQRERPGLTGLVAREVERDVQEGHLHGGQSATVQLLGRRAD